MPLCRSVLSDAEKKELDRLWAELYFATDIWEKMLRGFVFFERSERNFLKHPEFDSFKEEDPDLTKDETLARFKEVYLKRANVKLNGDGPREAPDQRLLRETFANGLKVHAATLQAAEPLYLKDLLAFAERAYRRPLTGAERTKLETFYADVCRDKDHGTEAAVRASVTRVLVSPHFAMRFDATPAGESVAPLSDLALASRLSYFIWSGPPDAELLALAKAGKLHDEPVLREQVRRMVKDPKVSRFALEFFGQWLGYRDFLTQEAVNRQVFPAFDDALKQAMFEEPTRLRRLPDSERQADHRPAQRRRHLREQEARVSTTGCRSRAPGTIGNWSTGLHASGRGGVLGMAVFLTKNSQPQRTSPVKRGFWVVHKVLGEHIPPPPADVAVLPAKETDTNGKTIRQLLKMHVEDAKCARCHQRFDPVGLAMEGFDPIGRSRAKDLAGRPVDNAVALPSGKEARGVPEFGDYLAKTRKAEFTKTLMPQVPRVRARPLAPVVRSAAAGEDAGRTREGRLQTVRGVRTGGDEPAVPHAAVQRFLPDQVPNRPATRRRKMTAESAVSRRVLLKGLGVTVALPWLESVAALANAPAAKKPAAAVRVPVHRRRHLAAALVGEGQRRGHGTRVRACEPLAPFKEKINVINGLCNKEGDGGHAKCTGNILSGAALQPRPHDQGRRQHGPTAGASTTRRRPRMPSLVLGCEQPVSGFHESQYSMVYASHISWRNSDSPVPIELYPSLAFDSLFGGKAGKLQGSILDDVLEQANDVTRQGERVRQAEARRVPVVGARDRTAGAAAEQDGEGGRPRGPRRPAPAAGAAEGLPRVRQADVRHHRAGVPDGPLAGRDAAACPATCRGRCTRSSTSATTTTATRTRTRARSTRRS